MVKYKCPANNKEQNTGKRSRKQLQRSLSKKCQQKHDLAKRRKKLKLAKLRKKAKTTSSSTPPIPKPAPQTT